MRSRSVLVVAVMAASIAGCATAPQVVHDQPVQTPVRGESLHQILERHGTVHTAYTFWLDGRTYSLRQVTGPEEKWWLIFQDGWIECWRTEAQIQSIDPEIRNLAWLGQPDGLTQLADRLQQTCARVPTAQPPRTTPSANDPTIEVEGEPGTFGPVGTAVATVATVALFPLVLVLVGIAEVVESEMEVRAGEPVDVQAHYWELQNLPYTVDALVDWLGDPRRRFILASGQVEVLEYVEDGLDAAIYIGVSDGQAVWVAGQDSWLEARAEGGGITDGQQR